MGKSSKSITLSLLGSTLLVVGCNRREEDGRNAPGGYMGGGRGVMVAPRIGGYGGGGAASVGASSRGGFGSSGASAVGS